MLVSSSPYITVSQGYKMPITVYSTAPAGQVRFDGTHQCLQVYDGTTWHNLPTPTDLITVSAECQEILDWARKQKTKQQELETLMEKHPGLRDLYQRFQVMLQLVQQNNIAL